MERGREGGKEGERGSRERWVGEDAEMQEDERSWT